jgi:multidrug resistance efflux pump
MRLALAAAAGLAAGWWYCTQTVAPSIGSPTDRPIEPRARMVVCTGRVEALRGEVDVAAQLAGQLAEVRVREGDFVENGTVLAVLDSARQAADVAVAERNVRLARAHLERHLAGNGREDIAQALAAANSVKAELAYEEKSLERARKVFRAGAMSQEDLDLRSQAVERLRHQHESLEQRYQALRRGSLAQEIDVARAEVTVAEAQLAKARVEHEYCEIRAPFSGTVLKLYRQAGDSVLTQVPTPIARLADTRDLRVRLEIDEASVPLVRPGLEGDLEVRGVGRRAGRVKVARIVPTFGPRRLFNPDTSERHDVRTLTALCSVRESGVPLYPGQRVTAHLKITDAPGHGSEHGDLGTVAQAGGR